MPKPLIQFLLALLLAGSLYAQETVADSIPINKDSIEKELDDFLKLFDSLHQPKSYFLAGVGVGNTQFSVKNIALNAQQTQKNMNLQPTIAYYHKSGFAITYNNFIALSSNQTKLYQHTLTPSYTYEKGKWIEAGVSYTRYFSNQSNSELASPYKNDLFAFAEYKKWKLKPSVSFGFANGAFAEYSQTDTFAVIKRYLRPDTTVYFKQFDTLNVKLRDYSVIASLRRDFNWDGFTAKDYFTFSPSFLLYFGLSDYDVEYISMSKLTPELTQYLRQNLVQAYQFSRMFPRTGSSRNFKESGKFNLQSLGLSLDATWYIGKFYINPQIYFDYYLLSSENKFNTLYTVQAGIMF